MRFGQQLLGDKEKEGSRPESPDSRQKVVRKARQETPAGNRSPAKITVRIDFAR